MSRRRSFIQPLSPFAVWARRLAFFSIPVALLAIIFERTGIFEIYPVMATFGASLVLAGAAILLAFISLAVIWFTGDSGTGHAVIAMLLSILVLGYPGYLGYKAYKLPAIYDVTTDPYDPPRFEAVARLRTREANPVAYGGLATYTLQRRAYPEIEAISATVTAQQAYDAALSVVNKRKWRIVDERPPLAGRREGRIEAIALSPIMGFRDDVVIRIRATGNAATKIDLRSASRYGFHDFGANAKRVSELIDDIDDMTSPDAIERAARRAARAAKAAQQKPAAAQPAAKR
jgi:uncharacterized protein (DUF1499 family)